MGAVPEPPARNQARTRDAAATPDGPGAQARLATRPTDGATAPRPRLPTARPSAGEVTPNASLARRAASLSYEALLVSAVVLVAGFALAPLVTPAQPGAALPRVPALGERVLTFCAAFAVAAAYFVTSWVHGRRTLAMKTWRLRMVDVAGRDVDRKRALARYLAAWIGPAMALAAYAVLHAKGLGAHALWMLAFNFLWALIDPERQFLHDRIAGTRIVVD